MVRSENSPVGKSSAAAWVMPPEPGSGLWILGVVGRVMTYLSRLRKKLYLLDVFTLRGDILRNL